nr:hypothetical protein [Tanacetum cinerariifolium]
MLKCYTACKLNCFRIVVPNDNSIYNAIPTNGIYEIDMHDLVPNDNSIYNVSTKRAKHNLNSTYLWHCRLAHISKKHIEKLQPEGLLKSIDDESFDQCVSCLSGKMRRKLFLHRPERATDLLGIIHTDHKHEVFETFKVFKNEVENQLGKTIKAFRSNRGGEYISQEFKDYLKACRIVQQLTPPYIPQHNGVSERRNPKSLMEIEGFKPPQEEEIPIRRSERSRRVPNRLCLNVEAEEHSLGDLNIPINYKAAMLDLESNKWLDAMNAKMQSMIDNKVWVLVDLPSNCKTVGTKGYTQLYEVDYEETFSPVAEIRAIRILISIAAFYDYEIWQMEVKTAFLNGYLDENIYMASGSNVTFLILYVDDIIIMGNHIPSSQSVKNYFGKCFAMKDLREAAFIFGIKIYKDRSKRLIELSQSAYMDKILKRYKMDNSKRGHIPCKKDLT